MEKHDKISVCGLGELSGSLLIPLAVRANEGARKRPLLTDAMAADIFARCDADGMSVDGGAVSTHGILARTVAMDGMTRAFLRAAPNAVVINMGAGLDTRFFRVDNGAVRWYDIDLPAVIALRRRFIGESERLRFAAASVTEPGWTGCIDTKNSPVLIIAEGLLMYLTPDEVRALLGTLADTFAGAELIADVVHSYFVGKGMGGGFKWGIDRAEELAQMDARVNVLEARATGDMLRQRQPLLLRAMNVMPSTRRRSQIVRLRLG